jgi:hypothetical protein
MWSWPILRHYAWWYVENRENSVKIDGFRAEIRIQDLPNKEQYWLLPSRPRRSMQFVDVLQVMEHLITVY